MALIIRSKVSRADLAEQWFHAARDSARKADSFVKRLDRRLKR